MAGIKISESHKSQLNLLKYSTTFLKPWIIYIWKLIIDTYVDETWNRQKFMDPTQL
jgi:hypothetical protein